MRYDVQIDNSIRRGLSYAELIMLPIEAETFVRRENSQWMYARECVELSHVIVESIPAEPSQPYNYAEEPEEEYDYEDEYEQEEEEEEYEPQPQYSPAPQPYHQPQPLQEERIFIPTAEYFKCKQKRKAAIIGVCTLGFAGLTMMGIGNTWRSNIFAGTSFSANAGIAFVLKCLSFCLLSVMVAVPYFIYSVFALIYYSIRLNSLSR